MPDVHVGYGVPIGYTQTIKDTVVPNFVGVDIGCGLLVSKLSNEKDYQINFHKLVYVLFLNYIFKKNK